GGAWAGGRCATFRLRFSDARCRRNRLCARPWHCLPLPSPQDHGRNRASSSRRISITGPAAISNMPPIRRAILSAASAGAALQDCRPGHSGLILDLVKYLAEASPMSGSTDRRNADRKRGDRSAAKDREKDRARDQVKDHTKEVSLDRIARVRRSQLRPAPSPGSWSLMSTVRKDLRRCWPSSPSMEFCPQPAQYAASGVRTPYQMGG